MHQDHREECHYYLPGQTGLAVGSPMGGQLHHHVAVELVSWLQKEVGAQVTAQVVVWVLRHAALEDWVLGWGP